MSVFDSLPIRSPSLALGIVVTLSTMTRLGVLSPLALSGSSGISAPHSPSSPPNSEMASTNA